MFLRSIYMYVSIITDEIKDIFSENAIHPLILRNHVEGVVSCEIKKFQLHCTYKLPVYAKYLYYVQLLYTQPNKIIPENTYIPSI